MTTTTDAAAPHYVAQLILSLPGKSGTGTITITLLPDDTVSVEGEKKALADCTLRELRAFANSLEAEIWQTNDEISLLDMSKAKDVTVELSRLDKDGKVVAELDDWASSIVVLPVAKAVPKSAPAKQVPEKPKAATTSKAVASGTAPPKSDTSGTAQPKSKESIPETANSQPKAEAKPQPVAEEPTPAEPGPQTARDKKEDIAAVAATIAFPPPVKPKDVEEAKPKTTERPHAPATIEQSEARVRVAGKRLPGGTAGWAAIDILMDEPPLRAMQAHALSSLDREVAGVMVGPRPEKQPDGRYLVRVIDSIAAKYTVMQGASVTYTADSWKYLNDTLGERYPDETGAMVGWYHTHPGFGIFLSGMDQFIHQNFFTQIWHTAYVLDPRARSSGFFCWSRDKKRVSRYEFAWPDWAEDSW